jgi:hypothetical protein
MNQRIIYHYTNREGWEGIRFGQRGYLIKHPLTGDLVESETVKGWMIPHRRLIPEGIESSSLPEQASQPAIFGLPEPKPKSWLDYKDCTSVWDDLLSCCSKMDNRLILLKLSLTENDHPIIVDYVHLRRMAKELSEKNSSEEYRRKLIAGNKAYWESQTPLDKYSGTFILPEIVVFNPIPLERVEFVEETPIE